MLWRQLSQNCQLNVILLPFGISTILSIAAPHLSMAEFASGSPAPGADWLPVNTLGGHACRAGEMTEFLALSRKIVSGVWTTWNIRAQALYNLNSR
jgi:hypothetical protein